MAILNYTTSIKSEKSIMEIQSYFIAVDGKRDFIVYNANDYQMSNEKLQDTDLVELKLDNEIINKLKSDAWSSNCKWFFVIQDEGIYLFHIYNSIVWFCKKHTTKFIEMYLDKNI